MAYTKTNWVNDESPDIDADNLNKMEQGIYDAQFPDGGTEGQILARTANGRGWVDPPNSAVWGLIQGTLSDQTDLAMALENTGKVDTVNGIEPDVLTKNVQVDVEITKDGWDALPSTKYTDDINYYIKDGTNVPQASVISASGVQYDNTTSGLTADDVQDAIDENASEIADVKSGLNVSDISSNFTINSSYVDNFCANKTGKVAVVSFRIKASCPNNTTLVTMSDSVKASYNDVVSPFFGSNGSIQTQGSAWIERSNRSVITYYGSSNMTSGAYTTVTYIIS